MKANRKARATGPADKIASGTGKHAQIAGLDLKTFRAFLKKKAPGRVETVSLEDAIDFFRCSAREADDILRRAATAGYLEFRDDERRGPHWFLALTSLRLAKDPLLPPIDRKGADERIAKVIDIARAINAEPDSLHRVSKLTLFGSALYDTVTAYGDVDIDATIVYRKLDEAEKARVTARLAPKVPVSIRNEMAGRTVGEVMYSERDTIRKLRPRDRHISVSFREVEGLGCAHKVIYRYDPETEAELEPDSEITQPRSNEKSTSPGTAAETSNPLPECTIYTPEGFELRPDQPIDLPPYVRYQDMPDIEARAWNGRRCADGSRSAVTINEDREAQLALSRHLCPSWRKTLPAMAMMRDTFEWWAATRSRPHALPVIRLQKSGKSRTACFMSMGSSGIEVSVDLVSDRIEGYILFGDGAHTSIEAAHFAFIYAIATSLGRMLDELTLRGGFDFELEFQPTFVLEEGMDLSALPKIHSIGGDLRKFLNEAVSFDNMAAAAKAGGLTMLRRSVTLRRTGETDRVVTEIEGAVEPTSDLDRERERLEERFEKFLTSLPVAVLTAYVGASDMTHVRVQSRGWQGAP